MAAGDRAHVTGTLQLDGLVRQALRASAVFPQRIKATRVSTSMDSFEWDTFSFICRTRRNSEFEIHIKSVNRLLAEDDLQHYLIKILARLRLDAVELVSSCT